MAVTRVGREFGMELARDEPRVRRYLDHLHEVVDRQTREPDTRSFELLAVMIVELEAMAVTLLNCRSTIARRRE